MGNEVQLAGLNSAEPPAQPIQQTQPVQQQTPVYRPAQQQPAYQPPAYTPPAYAQPAQAQEPPQQRYVPAQPAYQAPQAVAAVPPVQPVRTASNPSPILANSTVRVIATNFNAPSGLAFDRTGHLYIANFATNSIDRISPGRQPQRFQLRSQLQRADRRHGRRCEQRLRGELFERNHRPN